MEQRFESVENRLDSMEQRFESVDKRFDSMDQRFESVDKRFDSMEQNTNEKFAAIDKRFDSIEETIVKEIESTRAELKAEIQYVHDELKDLRTDLANVEQVTAKNWLDISRLKAIR
ncbi:MAG: hypothetical protein GXY88_06755 [Tissierellia bacterium]|nr:hypothetical protein [Tissierellia bacterium]